MANCYVHPDNIELYVGLLAEERKPTMIGSGLAPGYTISRAILSVSFFPSASRGAMLIVPL